MPDARLLSQEIQDRFVSAAHDRPEVAREMLRSRRDLAVAASSWGETGLQAASHLGHRRLITELAEAGSVLDVFAAAAAGDRSLATTLLAGASSEACGVHDLPLLHFGIMSGEMPMIELLTHAGIEINPPNASLPPLHSAVAVGFSSAVLLLLRLGADIEAIDPFGATAEDWARALLGPQSAIAEILRCRDYPVSSSVQASANRSSL
jgi:ankyrin repeat protein